MAGPGRQMRSGVATLTAGVQCLWTCLHCAQELLRVPLRRAGEHGGVQRVGFCHRIWVGLGRDMVLACGRRRRSNDDTSSEQACSDGTPWGQRRSSSAHVGPADRPRLHHSAATGRRRSRHAAAQEVLNFQMKPTHCSPGLFDLYV